MLRQLAIQISKSEWPDFTTYLDMPLAHLQGVVGYISTAMPVSDLEDLAKLCAEVIGVSEDTIQTVLVIGVNTSRLQRSLDISMSETLERIAVVLENGDFPDWKEKYSLLWKERQPLLEALLAADGVLEIMSKARELLYEFQCLLLKSAVLTDVRHVYNREATSIKAGMVIHTLTLTLYDGTESRETHVTLSAVDVEKLMGQLKRSLRKGEVATKMLEQSGLPELTPRKNV